ncbi:MAG: DUF2971 domain-containing protein [Thermodesulfobacteriota bacterium]
MNQGHAKFADMVSWKEEYFDLMTEGLCEKAELILTQNRPKRLYKFYSLSDLSINNIKADLLWFSNPQYYNDPYDSSIQQYFSFGKFLIENDLISLLLSKIDLDRDELLVFKEKLFSENKSIKEVVNNFLEYLSNLHDQVPEKERLQIDSLIRKIKGMRIGIYDDNIINTFFERLYIACFTEIKDDILMWSHYAGANTGFCVEYDLENYWQTARDQNINIVPIVYKNELFSYREYKNCSNPIPQIIMKNYCWNYEKEWRMVIKGDRRLKGTGKRSPKILKVILGANFNYSVSSELKERLVSLIRSKNIEVSRMRPEENRYRLNEYPIKL